MDSLSPTSARMVDEIERTEKRAALLTRLANAKRKQAEAQLQYDAASSGSAADPMVTPASSQGAGVASTAAGSGGGSGNSGSGAGSGAGGGGGGGAAAGRRRSTPRLCELGFSQFGNSALKAGPGKFIAHEGDLKTFIKLEISDEDQVLVQFEEGASRVVLGSRSGVVDELLSCIINATNSQEACSLLRAGVRLIKKHVKEDIDNAPSLVNESIGVLAVAPNAKAIAGTMVSTVLGGSGVDTRQCTSVYFKPLIKLACSYFKNKIIRKRGWASTRTSTSTRRSSRWRSLRRSSVVRCGGVGSVVFGEWRRSCGSVRGVCGGGCGHGCGYY